MGSIGTTEVIVVLVAALLILGPQKLPGAARQVGRAISEFRRMTTGFQDEVKHAFAEDVEPPRYDAPAPSPAPLTPPAASPTPPEAGLPAPPEDPTRN